MAEGIVSSVVINIATLVVSEINYLQGVSEQVKVLQTELKYMQRYLKDADGRADERVREWVCDIRNLAYDVENVIETFVIEMMSRSEKKGFRNKCKKYAGIFIHAARIHSTGKEIESIIGQIRTLHTSMHNYGIKLQCEENSVRTMKRKQLLRRSYSHVVEEHTVGLDNDLTILIEKVFANKKKTSNIVSIYGMGGLGKTTLTNKLYHHHQVRQYFDAFAWCCVSQQFEVIDILKGILVKLSSSLELKIAEMDSDEMAKELYQIQQKKKCLVIFDDMWKEEDWDLLKHAFPIQKIAGMVVFTTRNKNLALYADPNAFLYQLQTLTEESSWKLFESKAFPIKDSHNSSMQMEKMENMGRDMVKKCGGLPLAIITLRGLLSTKNSLDEWEKVHKNVYLYLERGNNRNQDYSAVHGILQLSYDELPYRIKPCFLLLAHFPEDYKIPRKTMIQLWIAEGFVYQVHDDIEKNETMEDIAESYLDELISRSIVQIVERGFVTYRLHDVMRDFCLSMATKENFLKNVHIKKSNVNFIFSNDDVRRLSIYANVEHVNFRTNEVTTKHRSLFLFGPFDMKFTLNKFKFLRVLRLDKCMIGEALGREIGCLVHLRYVAFVSCYYVYLEPSIGNLRYLQTLIMEDLDPRGCLSIPNTLAKLEQLRVLHVKGSDISKLNLSCHYNLEVLDLEGYSRLLPLNIPPNLTTLTLKWCSLEEDTMITLERLPNLVTLEVFHISYRGNILVCSSKRFPQLKTLILRSLSNLMGWIIENGAMPNLSHLKIEDCSRLKRLPYGIQFIKTLEKLEIINMPTSFSERLHIVNGIKGEDYSKIEHVHSIEIKNYYEKWEEWEEAWNMV